MLTPDEARRSANDGCDCGTGKNYEGSRLLIRREQHRTTRRLLGIMSALAVTFFVTTIIFALLWVDALTPVRLRHPTPPIVVDMKGPK